MNEDNVTTKATPSTTQIHVRTGIRSGNAAEKCQQEVADLKKHYNQLMAEARQRGISI